MPTSPASGRIAGRTGSTRYRSVRFADVCFKGETPRVSLTPSRGPWLDLRQPTPDNVLVVHWWPCGRLVVPSMVYQIGDTDRTRGFLPRRCPSWH